MSLWNFDVVEIGEFVERLDLPRLSPHNSIASFARGWDLYMLEKDNCELEWLDASTGDVAH